MMLQIGSVALQNRVITAPMAGITDPPFRKILRKYGRGLVCGEMVSAMALHYNNVQTQRLIGIDPDDHPVSIQIFGSDPLIMSEAARKVEARGADLIDINMGCPVPKVIKNGDGAALLNNLPLAGKIIRAVVESVTIPVTVKFRLGWDSGRIVAPDLAKIAEDCGAAGVTVHARTREQLYQGEADWDRITEVKMAVSIPVIGNGDINSPQDAQAMIRQTNCDGVMIGQALLGRPWIFGQIINCLDNGIFREFPSLEEQFAVIFEHLDLQVAYSGEERGIKEARKHLAWYLKGTPGSAKIREMINGLTSLAAVKEALLKYVNTLEVERGQALRI